MNTGSGFSVQLNANYWSFTLVRRSVIHNRQVDVRFIIGYCIINYGTIDKVQWLYVDSNPVQSCQSEKADAVYSYKRESDTIWSSFSMIFYLLLICSLVTSNQLLTPLLQVTFIYPIGNSLQKSTVNKANQATCM